MPCTEEELLRVVKSLAKQHSKGPDGIPCYILYENIPNMYSILNHAINYSFETGIFHDCLKRALVVPIYKKKCRKDTTNYRPVSLLNAFSKVIEKLLYSRIYSYMNDKLCPSQFRFHPGHQTMDLMVFSMDSPFEAGTPTCGVRA